MCNMFLICARMRNMDGQVKTNGFDIKQGTLRCMSNKPSFLLFFSRDRVLGTRASHKRHRPVRFRLPLFRQYQGMLKSEATSRLDDLKTCCASGSVRQGATARKSKVSAIRQSCRLYLLSQPTEATDDGRRDVFYQFSA